MFLLFSLLASVVSYSFSFVLSLLVVPTYLKYPNAVLAYLYQAGQHFGGLLDVMGVRSVALVAMASFIILVGLTIQYLFVERVAKFRLLGLGVVILLIGMNMVDLIISLN